MGLGKSLRNAVRRDVADKSEPAYPPRPAIKRAAEEVSENPPAILAKTAKKSGKAQSKKQKVAIILSKARRGK